MTESNALTVQSNNYSIMPVMDILQAKQRRQAIIDFVAGLMVQDVHYGKIPGTNKDTLMKPGAEMLTTFFGLAPRFIAETVTEDWTGEGHGGEPFFYYRYRCELRRGDMVIGDGIGSCNSWEGKYRFRNASKQCPECGAETIIKGKAEYGGGWLCFAKKGGCGAKFRDGDAAIEGQVSGKVKNDNPQDIVNTIDKMAQKRALVAATLIAVNASEFFTQDVEDMVFDGIYTEVHETKPAPSAAKPATTTPKPATKQTPRKVFDVEDGKGNDELRDLEIFVEDDGELTDLDTIRLDLAKYPRMTFVQVANAAVDTGLYTSKEHAENALKQNDSFKQSGNKLSSGIDGKVGLEIFDWLVSRKAD